MDTSINTRICHRCKLEKPAGAFNRCSANYAGIGYCCKDCERARVRKPKQTDRHGNSKCAEELLLRDLYEEFRMSQPEIAELLGVHARSVRRWMSRYGIVGRNDGPYNPRYKTGLHCGKTQYQRHRKDACERCGSIERLGVHHKDFDHYNNDPANLETVCVSCHMSGHKTLYWASVKRGETPRRSNGRVGWDDKPSTKG